MPGRVVLVLIGLLICGVPKLAAAAGVYDVDALGVPKFVNVVYIELSKISQISKFRSSAGHDYFDDFERCRSMKHYFLTPDATTNIWSPVAGTVTRLDDDFVGKQVWITSDLQPAFTFIIFHVNLVKPLALGEHIDEGQRLGTHIGTQTYSDIAVGVNVPRGYKLVSYFDTLTDTAFAAFQARGVKSRSQLIFSKEERDADPYQCNTSVPAAFLNLRVPPESEYVDLSGAQRIQTTVPPAVLLLSDSPYALGGTSTSGLPVVVGASPATVCTVSGDKLNLVGPGQCFFSYQQPGNAEYFPATPVAYLVTVLAAPAGPRIGAVFSSTQSTSQSFLRFYNAGTAPESVNVSLDDSTSGQTLATWNSPSIPAGASVQYPISTIENGATPAFAKPSFYTLAIQTRMSGSVQHVLYRPSDGTLTNLSTCDTGAAVNRGQLTNVHSSLLQNGYPSTVVVTNTAATAAPVQLGVFDATTGVRLGTYTTPSVPANGQVSISIPALEAGAQVSPGTNRFHYIVNAEGNFSGTLQHLVTNTQVGITTDMTAVCPMRAVSAASAATRVGTVYSSAQVDLRSYLRVFNAGTRAGTVKLTLADSASGLELGQWTSPSIAPNVSQQFAIEAIESGAGIVGPKPSTYVISIQSQIGAGYLQHVVWRPSDGTLTNLSTCDGGVTALPRQLINVHSKIFDASYPSTVVVTNVNYQGYGAVLGAYDAASGVQYGAYVISYIPSMGSVQVPMSAIETRVGIPAGRTIPHFNIKESNGFPGFLQHLVNNSKAGVVTDMTTVCTIN